MYGAQQQPGSGWGQQPPWGSQPGHHYPPPIPPRKNHTGLIILVVLALTVLPSLVWVAVAVGAYWAVPGRHGQLLDAKEIPALIEKHLPCKATCRVTQITIADGWFAVSVVSDDIPGRTLLYRVYPATGAELGFSSDWGKDTMPATFDYRDVDWSLVPKLTEELNEEAIAGREVTTMGVFPCAYGWDQGKHKAACFQASVLSDKGDLKRTWDAKTGEAK